MSNPINYSTTDSISVLSVDLFKQAQAKQTTPKENEGRIKNINECFQRFYEIVTKKADHLTSVEKNQVGRTIGILRQVKNELKDQVAMTSEQIETLALCVNLSTARSLPPPAASGPATPPPSAAPAPAPSSGQPATASTAEKEKASNQWDFLDAEYKQRFERITKAMESLSAMKEQNVTGSAEEIKKTIEARFSIVSMANCFVDGTLSSDQKKAVMYHLYRQYAQIERVSHLFEGIEKGFNVTQAGEYLALKEGMKRTKEWLDNISRREFGTQLVLGDSQASAAEKQAREKMAAPAASAPPAAAALPPSAYPPAAGSATPPPSATPAPAPAPPPPPSAAQAPAPAPAPRAEKEKSSHEWSFLNKEAKEKFDKMTKAMEDLSSITEETVTGSLEEIEKVVQANLSFLRTCQILSNLSINEQKTFFSHLMIQYQQVNRVAFLFEKNMEHFSAKQKDAYELLRKDITSQQVWQKGHFMRLFGTEKNRTEKVEAARKKEDSTGQYFLLQDDLELIRKESQKAAELPPNDRFGLFDISLKINAKISQTLLYKANFTEADLKNLKELNETLKTMAKALPSCIKDLNERINLARTEALQRRESRGGNVKLDRVYQDKIILINNWTSIINRIQNSILPRIAALTKEINEKIKELEKSNPTIG